MKIVFICGGYYPNTSATGNCVRVIADMFTEQGYDVHVICKSAEIQNKQEFYRGQYLYRVTNERLSGGVRLATSTNRGLFHKVQVFCYKVRWALYGLARKDGLDDTLADAYYQQLVEIEKNGTIDAVVPCCMPAESLIAALRYQKDGYLGAVFPLLYDPYSENVNFFRFAWSHRLRKGNARKNENQLFSVSREVFYVDNWKEYFRRYPYENAVRVEHPLVVKRAAAPAALTGRTEVNAIYQGEINYQMRPPTAMLDLFCYIAQKDPSVSLHVCAYGNASKEVADAAEEYPDSIQFYGRVSKEQADGYYDAADVAVILANKNKQIVPSKIFECVSSGYPIVYLYFSEDETSYQLLKKYPMVYFLRQADKTSESFDRAYRWMLEKKGERVDFGTVQQLYSDATPDYVVNEIMNCCMKEQIQS